MKRAPIDFQNRLARLFDNRVRVRWSNQRAEWQIEYKVGRGKAAHFFVSESDDASIRAKDGYAFLLAVREGDRMPCPQCGYTVKVPLFEIKQIRCEYCKIQGKDSRYPAAYFPLEGDSLIQYLARIDPLGTWRSSLHKQADENNDRLLAQQERKFGNEIEAITKDNYNKLVGIQSVGLSGSTKMWKDHN